MKNHLVRRHGLLFKALISVTLFSAIAWASIYPLAADDTQPNTPSAENQPTKAAKLVLLETTHAFGKVYIGDTFEHIYRFVNEGNAVLDLIEIRSTCECTGTQPNKWHFEPGEEGEILVTFSPSENTRRGRAVKFIYIESNDPDTPIQKIKFTSNVRRDVSYTPRIFQLGQIPKGNTGKQRMVFKSKLNPEGFEITKVLPYHPSVDVDFGKLNDENAWYVDVLVKEDANPQKLSGNVTVVTNSEKQHEIKIETHAEVVREVTPLSNRVCFGTIVRGSEVVRSLTILHAKGINIERVKPTLSWVSAEITPSENSEDPTTKVSLKLTSANAPSGRSEGVLRVFTNSQTLPVIKIPICGNVKEPQT